MGAATWVGGLEEMGLSPTKFEVVELLALIFGKTCKSSRPTHGIRARSAIWWVVAFGKVSVKASGSPCEGRLGGGPLGWDVREVEMGLEGRTGCRESLLMGTVCTHAMRVG